MKKFTKLLTVSALTLVLAFSSVVAFSQATISADAASSGKWKNSGGWWYQYSNGSYAKGWEKISGTWYYFDNSGWMKTGWVKSGGKWYYMKSSGAMAKGWVNDYSNWYYMNSSGVMQANKWIGNYYVGKSGAMATNQWIGNYYVDGNGKWIPNYKASESDGILNGDFSSVAGTYTQRCANAQTLTLLADGSIVFEESYSGTVVKDTIYGVQQNGGQFYVWWMSQPGRTRLVLLMPKGVSSSNDDPLVSDSSVDRLVIGDNEQPAEEFFYRQ